MLYLITLLLAKIKHISKGVCPCECASLISVVIRNADGVGSESPNLSSFCFD